MARSLIRPASSCRPGQRRATGHGLKLIFFGRAGQRRHRRGAALDNGGDLVEVAGAHLLLMRDEGDRKRIPAAALFQHNGASPLPVRKHGRGRTC